MRVSVDSSDPGYNPAYFGGKVFLEAREVTGVITADDERGEVLRYKLDDLGRTQLTQDRKDVQKELLYGHVRIVLPAHYQSPADRQGFEPFNYTERS